MYKILQINKTNKDHTKKGTFRENYGFKGTHRTQKAKIFVKNNNNKKNKHHMAENYTALF